MFNALELMKASLGPAIATLGVAVAFAQWHTNNVKLRLDSYDRRLRVYKAAVAMLDSILKEVRDRRGVAAHASNQRPEKPYQPLPLTVVEAFRDCMLEAPFLFDEEVAYFMRRIQREAGSIQMYAVSVQGMSYASAQGTAHEPSWRELRDCEEWVGKARNQVQIEFERYLKIKSYKRRR